MYRHKRREIFMGYIKFFAGKFLIKKYIFNFQIFYLPMAFVIPPAHFLTHQQFSLLYQFWIHTKTITTLGPLEYIFNTPKHHRVHHGKFTFLRNTKIDRIDFSIIKYYFQDAINIVWIKITAGFSLFGIDCSERSLKREKKKKLFMAWYIISHRLILYIFR